MRIATWNIQRGPVLSKYARALCIGADVTVVTEASDPTGVFPALWVGDPHNQKLGVAVLTRSHGEFVADPLPIVPATPTWVVPFKVRGPVPFTLLAVWTVVQQNHSGEYAAALLAGLQAYAHLALEGPLVVAGDFNTNASYDMWRKPNHQAVANLLDAWGLVSVYHEYYQETQGAESRETHLNAGTNHFHIDYIFVPKSWAAALCCVSVGTQAEWQAASDHWPVIADFDVRHLKQSSATIP